MEHQRQYVGIDLHRRRSVIVKSTDDQGTLARHHGRESGTVMHTDHGSQPISWAFTENVRRLGLVSSMGTVGDCYDNAPMESFWGSLQVELLDRQRWRTNLELAIAIADYIEHFYNPTRRHSALGYLTPNEFENLHSPQPQATLS